MPGARRYCCEETAALAARERRSELLTVGGSTKAKPLRNVVFGRRVSLWACNTSHFRKMKAASLAEGPAGRMDGVGKEVVLRLRSNPLLRAGFF